MSGDAPVFVTGAGGFIGGRLAERLLADGRRVRALGRRPLPELARRGAEIVIGDLRDDDALRRGCAGAATVFHVAGRVGVWGPPDEFFRVNVDGTRRLLAAAQAAGVPRFVHTSSPSVVYHGGNLAGVDETAPLCTAAPCAYPTSKAAAERLVSAANAPGFATVSLRPHLVWGPGDRNVVPRILDLAARGRLRIVGHGRNLVDLTHIDNVVDAHLLAERALRESHVLRDSSTAALSGESHVIRDFAGDAPVAGSATSGSPAVSGGARGAGWPDSPARAGRRGTAGRAYFITNGEPVVLWDWINALLRGLGRPEITRRVPLSVAYAAGGALELAWRAFGLRGEPPMTRFVAKELATDHWFRIDAARRDLGYNPRVTLAAGTAALIAHYRAGNNTDFSASDSENALGKDYAASGHAPIGSCRKDGLQALARFQRNFFDFDQRSGWRGWEDWLTVEILRLIDDKSFIPFGKYPGRTKKHADIVVGSDPRLFVEVKVDYIDASEAGNRPGLPDRALRDCGKLNASGGQRGRLLLLATCFRD